MIQKNKKSGIHGLLLSILGAGLLKNLLAGKGVIQPGEGTAKPGQNL